MKWKEISDAEEPIVTEIVMKFSQNGNCNGTTAEYEELEITCEAPLVSLKQDHFYVLRTSTGWSFDKVEEIVYLTNHFKKIVSDEKV